jgi:hypothetical protein
MLMDDQTELFDRSDELTCPFAKRHDSPNACALEKYIRQIEDIRKRLEYLRNQTWDLELRLKERE